MAGELQIFLLFLLLNGRWCYLNTPLFWVPLSFVFFRASVSLFGDEYSTRPLELERKLG